MRGVLKNIRWYIHIFKCITSIGVYKQAKTHIHTYTRIKNIRSGKAYGNTQTHIHKYMRKYTIMEFETAKHRRKIYKINGYQRAFVYTAKVNGG